MVHSARGYLHVLGEDHRSLGFVGKEYNKYGEYGVLTNDSADYLSASIYMDKASSQNGVVSTVVSANAFSFTIDESYILLGQNGPLATYPFFGAIGGFSSTSNDLGMGSYESGGSCVFCGHR